MRKYIMVVVIAVCLALCAVVWPQGEAVEEIPKPTQEITENTPAVHTVPLEENAEVLPQKEKDNIEPPQPELSPETVPETEVTLPARPVAPEVQPAPELTPTLKPVSEPTPAQTVVDPQPGDMVYVPGFGWLESQGEGTVIHDNMMYENGNKVGIMGASE